MLGVDDVEVMYEYGARTLGFGWESGGFCGDVSDYSTSSTAQFEDIHLF